MFKLINIEYKIKKIIYKQKIIFDFNNYNIKTFLINYKIMLLHFYIR